VSPLRHWRRQSWIACFEGEWGQIFCHPDVLRNLDATSTQQFEQTIQFRLRPIHDPSIP
jgi:hypothetical protein